MDGLYILPVRNKKYVLCYAGSKRGYKHYDAICPTGEQIATRVIWDRAVEFCQLHYVKVTKFPKRRSKAKQIKLSKKHYRRLNWGNGCGNDKMLLKDFAEFSVEQSPITIGPIKGLYIKSMECINETEHSEE